MSDDKKPLPTDAQQPAGQTPADQQSGTVRQGEGSVTGPGPAAAGNGKPAANGQPPTGDPQITAAPASNPASGLRPPVSADPPSGSGTPAATDSQIVLPAPPQSGPTGVAVPIDYAMPSQRRSWLPSPALVRNLGCIFKLLFGFTILLCMGYFMLMAMNPKARQWALQGSKPGAGGAAAGPGPTPFKIVNQILALPAQALGKTDDVVKANNARAGVVDGLVAEEEATTKGKTGGSRGPVVNPFLDASKPPAAPAAGAGAATGTQATAGTTTVAEDDRATQAARMMELAATASAAPAAPKADAVRPTAFQTREPEVPAPVTLPGGIVIRSASPAGAPPATRTFLYWVVNLSLSGINPPRLLLNGRLVHEGQEVNITQGIVLDRIDPAAKLLHFRDATGAIVTRSY
ncbi:MAG: hypothetical protein ACOZE5_17660 [Verrucomicrobiota bacterium]